VIGGFERIVERLEAAVAENPGAADFPLLVELYRRTGRLAEAERVARRGLERTPNATEGHLALALVLFDQERAAEAQAALQGPIDARLAAAGIQPLRESPLGAHAEWTEAELEEALDSAQTDAEAFIDPDRVAQEAVAQVDVDLGESLGRDSLAEAFGAGGTFATRTMAELLERQGDANGAARIRAALDQRRSAPRSDAAGSPGPASRQRTLEVLEGWLQNLRGGAR